MLPLHLSLQKQSLDTHHHIRLWSSLFDLHIDRHYWTTSRWVRQGLQQSRWKITTCWSAEEFLPMQYQPRLSGITSTFTTFVSIIQGWRLFHANSRWAGIDCAVAFSRVYHVLVRNPVWRAHSRSSSKHFIHAVYTKYVSRMFMRHCTQSCCQHCKRETMYTAVLVPSRANIFSFLLMFNCSFYNVSTKRHTAVSTLSYVKLVWTQVSHHMHEKHHEINSHDFLCGGGRTYLSVGRI